MQINTTVFALTLTIAASGTLFASEIYKRIDSDGNVHFSDRPTVGAEHLSIRSRSTDPERVQARVQGRVESQTLSAEEKANAPQGPTADELRAEARERDEHRRRVIPYRDQQGRLVVTNLPRSAARGTGP